jgi:hypothetical protein
MNPVFEALLGMGNQALTGFESFDRFAKRFPWFQHLTNALYSLGSGESAFRSAGQMGMGAFQSPFQQALSNYHI